MEWSQLGPVPARYSGTDGAPIAFVTGPPFSAKLFEQVQLRLQPRRTVALELVASGVDRSAVEVLRAAVSSLRPRLIVAHGLAVPVALRSGALRVVVSNGPIADLDPVMASLARLPAPALEAVLRPGVLQRWMPSSIGLRRLVVNPYVMDHDMAVALAVPVAASPSSRGFAARWIRSTPSMLRTPVGGSVEISGIWGDGDLLYPVAQARSLVREDRLITVPGGRHLHPVERPWAFADALLGLCEG